MSRIGIGVKKNSYKKSGGGGGGGLVCKYKAVLFLKGHQQNDEGKHLAE